MKPLLAPVAVFVVVAAALSSCGGDSLASRPPDCLAAPMGVGPDKVPTAQNGDAGKTICLARHKSLNVFLYEPVNTAPWGAVSSTGNALEPRPATTALPEGVTAAIYQANRKGTARLSATRPPCTPPATTGCDAAHRWTVRVIVR